jgi:proton translocating ATP synthase F1 alpha subunit
MLPNLYKARMRIMPLWQGKGPSQLSCFSTTPAKVQESSSLLDAKIRRAETEDTNTGKVLTIAEGIANVQGLNAATYGEIVIFENAKLKGIIVSLEDGCTKVAILGNDRTVYEGEQVSRRDLLTIPSGDDLLGRVIDPTGLPLDEKAEITPRTKSLVDIFARPPGITQLKSIYQPLLTGIKAFDILNPTGLGHVKALVGDSECGMSANAVDAIIAQKYVNRTPDISMRMYCIYVGIGKNRSSLAHVIRDLTQYNALPYSIVVATTASDSPILRYLAPYVGATIAETFRNTGRHSLIVYDDLSKHAIAFKQMSASLRKPLGPNSFPADTFYLHARLLERSGKLLDQLGSGSMTVIAIVETDENSVVTDNVLQACDNHIKFDAKLYRKGFRPPIASFTRMLSKVSPGYQFPVLKRFKSITNLSLLEYFETAPYAKATRRVGENTDEYVQKVLCRGERLQRILFNQPDHCPMEVVDQALSIYAVCRGYFDKIELDHIDNAEKSWINHIRKKHPEIVQMLARPKVISVEDEMKLSVLCKEFVSSFTTIQG